MYMVLGLYKTDNDISYAVQVDADVEVLTELELKLLVSCNLPMIDSSGKPITINGDSLVCDVPDVTDEINNSIPEDDDYDGYEDYFDDIESEEDYEEDDSEIDEYDNYEDELESDDDSSDEEYESDYEDDYDEVYEDEEPEESTVSKLYKFLSDEQRTVLKRYYLWYSQRLFTEAQKDPTLGMKSQKALMRKKSNLNNLRQTGGLWHYAGFVDMGKKGEGYCTLGHPLRFMHLAWDVTQSDIETAFFGEEYDSNFEEAIESSNCIIFGIKCVADFFEVDSECVRSLQRAQRESLKDMALMYTYYADGLVDKVLNEFKFTSDLIKTVSTLDARGLMVMQGYEPILRKELTSFYLQFEKLNMIPPKSLVQEIRDSLVGWRSHVERQGHIKRPDGIALGKALGRIFNNKYPTVSSDLSNFIYVLRNTDDYKTQILAYIFVLFMYESCGFYKYNADTNNEEGGSSRGAKLELDCLYRNAVKNFFSDVEFSMGYLKKLCMLYESEIVPVWDTMFCLPMILTDSVGYKYIDDNRVVPVSNLISVYDEETGSNLEKAYQFYSAMRYPYKLILRPSKVIENRGNDTKLSLDEILSVFSENKKIIDEHYNKFKEWYRLRSEKSVNEYNSNLKAELKNKEREVEEEEKDEENNLEENSSPNVSGSTSEIKTVSDVVNYLSSSDLSKLDKKFDLHKNILATVLKSGKEPSSKQFYYIKSLYKEISGVDFSGSDAPKSDKVSLSDRKDIQDRVDYILNHRDDFEGIVCSIAESVKKYGTASQRQLKYIMEEK